MQGLILAAGMGKRLKELTQDNTKCMVKVNGVRLIDRVLGQLSKLDLKRTVIVIGYEGEKLRKHVGRKWNGMKIDYINNPIYDKTNNIYSLALAADELVKDDTLLLESDLIFEDSIFTRLLEDPHENVVCVDAYKSWMDGTCVTIDEENLIKRFVPKKDFCYEAITSYYKTVNVYKFSRRFSRENYVPFLKAYSMALGDNEYYEQVLRVIALLNKPLMYAMQLNGEKWYEIDDIQDLDIAESIFCEPEEQVKKIASRYGGYWRYPGLKDYTYLVNPYYPPRRLRDEMKASFDVLMENYPSGQRVNALLAAKVFGLKQGTVVVGNGAAEIINAWMNLLAGKVGFVYPTFEEYPNRIDECCRVTFKPSAANGFRYTADDLIKFFTKEPVSSLILINPDNPSGNFLPKKDVLKLVAWTKKVGTRLLIDESFVDFAAQPYTMLDSDFLSKNVHVNVMKSVSKSYGIPGFRLGILACPNEQQANLVKEHLSIWNINSFGEFFLQIAEKYRSDYADACRKIVVERYRFFAGLKKIPFLKPYPSHANFILCEVKKPFTSNSLMMSLWTSAKCLIKDCSMKKGFDGAQFIRLAVRNANDNDELLEALRRLDPVLFE
ncbi:MAG: aminotransferase class I/II-fold pyridoxal phosphate-dependent enzyme [Lentisphaerae bacterium]|nr:aminotransferase class I/II-fold pyridoxal phosphate-dependent enzyme [Lentisphaerota bacterium]